MLNHLNKTQIIMAIGFILAIWFLWKESPLIAVIVSSLVALEGILGDKRITNLGQKN